jgi:RNA polymerase sigma-70 factor (ECF subfamily)
VGTDHAAPTDQQLLRTATGGDEDAFVEVYRRYRDRVYRFAYRMTGSPEAARDITHSCFAGLLGAPSRYDGRASLGTYLCAAARNQSLRHATRTWRERPASTAAECPDHGPSPLDLVLQDERARIVREAVRALAPLYREVLILAEYEDLDLATIGEIVGAEVGTVKVRLHRARRKLRGALERLRGSGVLTVE